MSSPSSKSKNAACRRRNQMTIDGAKDKPCEDCGVKYPIHVMDFDHVKGEKLFQIGRRKHVSTGKLLAEIAKCDVVCANCHRSRTYLRMTNGC